MDLFIHLLIYLRQEGHNCPITPTRSLRHINTYPNVVKPE
jgi:hypothetical protein